VKLRALAALIVALPVAQAAAQGLPVSAPEEIVAGTQSCATATSATGVDERKLQADGWHHATMSADGKPVDGLNVYSRGKLLLMLTKGAAKICPIMARIQDAGTFGDIAFAMDKSLGVKGAARQGEQDTLYWFPPDHIVQMKLTGKAEAPSVRVAVGYNPGEKK
jgi:hypothetical protein